MCKKEQKLAEIRETESKHGKREKICGARSHGKKEGLGWRKHGEILFLLHGKKTMEGRGGGPFAPDCETKGTPDKAKRETPSKVVRLIG